MAIAAANGKSQSIDCGFGWIVSGSVILAITKETISDIQPPVIKPPNKSFDPAQDGFGG
jgi:hypothetical protein